MLVKCIPSSYQLTNFRPLAGVALTDGAGVPAKITRIREQAARVPSCAVRKVNRGDAARGQTVIAVLWIKLLTEYSPPLSTPMATG